MIYSEKFELDRDIEDFAHEVIYVNAHTEYDRHVFLILSWIQRWLHPEVKINLEVWVLITSFLSSVYDIHLLV